MNGPDTASITIKVTQINSNNNSYAATLDLDKYDRFTDSILISDSSFET